MRKKAFLLLIFIMTLCLTQVSNASAADSSTPPGGGMDIGFIGWLGVGGLGCSATQYDTECSDDPENGMFSSIACRVLTTFNKQVIPIYCNIVQNPQYMTTINAAMIFYVTLMGITFLTGMVPMRTGVVVGKVIKLAFIYTLVSNADFYFNVVFNATLRIPQEMVRVILESDTTSGNTGTSNFFEYVDQGIYKMFETFKQSGSEETGATYEKSQMKILIMGLALWQVGGDLVGGIFFSVIVGWMVAYISIMIRYLLAMLSMMFLLMLGPLFIPTLLFDRIKFLGEEWIKMIISHIVQIVVVIAFLVMVQTFFIEFFDLVKEGLKDPTLKESQAKYMVNYSQDAVGEETTTGYANPEVTKEYTDQLLKGDTFEKMPKFIFDLLIMWVICFCSYLFLQKVPSFATMLSGNVRFAQLFGGTAFSSRSGSEMTAKLAGQPGSGINHKEDPVGKMFSDLTTTR